MRVADEVPAQTWSMAVVHEALLRDLTRSRRELVTAPYPERKQRRAVAAHLLWLMDFLHHHHTSEDTGLWPLVRRRNPAAAALLDSLEADHQRVSPAMASVSAAATMYRNTADHFARVRLVDALDELGAVLAPHLEREVSEGMPVVSASITNGEWADWDNRYNIKPKSPRQLGLIGHWLVDGQGEEVRDMVFGLVPPLPRFVLAHAFARPYLRGARARWRATTTEPATVEA
jgi:hemerythrin-like domain-containing protein